MSRLSQDDIKTIKSAQRFFKRLGLGLLVALVGIVVLWLWGMPKYRIYKLELAGKAQLAQQEWAKQILIEEAKALKESAILKAEAEVERAKGLAQANEIAVQQLGSVEAYLRYLFIETLGDSQGERIYIATEAGLPILERR